MRDAPAYCVAALAVLVTLLCLGLLVEANSRIRDLEHRVQETQCAFRVSEDGYGYTVDDEVSQDCLREQLGWFKP